MNKVQVGAAPSPNLKVVRSKIGSLQNTSYKPGGGQVKIENRKLEWKAGTRVIAKNDTYVPGGGDKKVICDDLIIIQITASAGFYSFFFLYYHIRTRVFKVVYQFCLRLVNTKMLKILMQINPPLFYKSHYYS